MSKFQLATIIFFIAIAILALLMFSGVIPTPKPKGNETKDLNIVMWGTLPTSQMQQAFTEIRQTLGSDITVTYEEKGKDTLKVDLLTAALQDTSPDIVLFPSDSLLQISDILFQFPETSISERNMKDTFIEGGDLFISPAGVSALPFLVDPLVMYWNRDIFNKDRITAPPSTWSEVRSLTRVLTKTDGRGKILQSAAAIGESRNVDHFKDIVSLFFLQTGDGIISRNNSTHEPYVYFGGSNLSEGALTPAVSALSFYTGFANVRSSDYSWNGSFSSSLESFVEGDVALYFGPASDYRVIVNKNPHLNFDVTPVPQLKNTNNVTFGKIYALGFPKDGKNIAGAFSFALALTATNDVLTNMFVNMLSLPPARRTLLAKGVGDPVLSVFFKEAIITKGWLDPKPEESEAIFSRMVTDTVSETTNATEAISSARTQLNSLLKKNTK